jgi:hypothetical protein
LNPSGQTRGPPLYRLSYPDSSFAKVCYLSIITQELRKAIKFSSRIAGLGVDIPTLNLPIKSKCAIKSIAIFYGYFHVEERYFISVII